MQKAFDFYLSKKLDDYETSPLKKSQNSSIKDPNDESPFSFSFNNFSTKDLPKPKESRKLSFGLNLLHSFFTQTLSLPFKLLKSNTSKPNPAQKIINLYNSKKKRASFIKWYVQSIKISSESRVTTAITTINKLNTFSRKYIACSIVFGVFDRRYILSASQLWAYCKVMKSQFDVEFTLISGKTRDRWAFKGLLIMSKVLDRKIISLKTHCFLSMKDDISLQRQAFIQNTDRCIVLSEQLFEAKEAKEKAEFEKEELAAVLDSKTEELNKLLDIVEEYKSFQGKLNSMEKGMNEEIAYWKTQANKLQVEYDKKNKEIIEVYSDKKKAEEECLKAYRNLDVAQRQNLDLQKKIAENPGNEVKECEKCPRYEKEISTYNELIEEFRKSEEKLQQEISALQEQLSRPPSVVSQKSKAKIQKKPVKKTLELDKPSISENENQLAIEIVNLNKQVTKLKHENRTCTEIMKKAQQELLELKKILQGKDEALNRLRKENDQLSLSLTTDHYKSVHKLEFASTMIEQKNKELCAENSALGKSLEEARGELENVKNQCEEMKEEIKSLKEASLPNSDTARLVENMNSLQCQFYRLKQMSDKQIQTIESLKQDNYQLMQSIESLKSFARSSKLHADKAAGDADAYAAVIKKMETEIAQITHAKDRAENEVVMLKQHLMKVLGKQY